MDFFRDCRIATQFCTLLTRPPWLDTAWQERKNPSLPQYRLAKETRSLHSQRSVKRPVEGNISQKKTFVKRRSSALPASPIPVIPSSVFPYAKQLEISFGCSGRQVQIFNNCYSKIC